MKLQDWLDRITLIIQPQTLEKPKINKRGRMPSRGEMYYVILEAKKGRTIKIEILRQRRGNAYHTLDMGIAKQEILLKDQRGRDWYLFL